MLLADHDGQQRRTRLGTPHTIDMQKSDFVHVFSVRKKWPAHINYLEGTAFIMLLRWILRSRANHSSRVVILVDSAVWLGTAAKGRSSTMLNRLLRRAAALEMAGDLTVHVVLVPSAENPSDIPSRGVRVKRPRKLLRRSKRLQSLLNLCRDLRRQERVLRVDPLHSDYRGPHYDWTCSSSDADSLSDVSVA